jgi:hypothetical protein
MLNRNPPRCFGLRAANVSGTALFTLLEPKLTLPADRALFDAIRAFTGPPDRLHADTNIVRLAGTPRNTSKAAKTDLWLQRLR